MGFDLSQCDSISDGIFSDNDLIAVADIKEFLRLLKEEFKGAYRLNDSIDKLAGYKFK